MEQAEPHTLASIAQDLRSLGLSEGDTLLLHGSQRSLGFVVGGTQTVVQAILDVLGPTGTCVVPTQTSDNTEPSAWLHPPVPREWWPVIRESTPGFDPARTPSRWMGVIAEAVRTWPGAVRSNHPQCSFAALGYRANEIVAEHRLDDALGESSPLGAIYRLGGKVMLLGCGYDSNTSLHLAEYRQKQPPLATTGSSVLGPDGLSHWVSWSDIVTSDKDFEQLGEAFEESDGAVIGHVGNARTSLMEQPALVDFATTWMATWRSSSAT
ncbi:aminoglycoside N(3)-acetyltransferase [Microbacterium sp. ZW CA_36]|uniref:aminoglycoside N(3)-acetyltransferase n=1 Tax=Microbacterium sp. ZW CA_36 TaxID=3378078 RepID=UPI003855320F